MKLIAAYSKISGSPIRFGMHLIAKVPAVARYLHRNNWLSIAFLLESQFAPLGY